MVCFLVLGLFQFGHQPLSSIQSGYQELADATQEAQASSDMIRDTQDFYAVRTDIITELILERAGPVIF